jgi:large subunit ribosomal protein L25
MEVASIFCYNNVISLEELTVSVMAQDTINLVLEPRKVTGKAVRHLRRDGVIPAVIHDHGKESVHVQGDAVAMLKVWRAAGKHHPVELKNGSDSYVALIKEASFDPKKHLLTHVVFNAVDRNQKVDADVPIKPHYEEENEASPAERAGLIVLAQLETVQIRAIANKIPDVLEYNAEKLVDIGDHVTVADLIMPEGVELLTEPEHSIATVYEPSALAAANDAAGGDAEPGDEAEVESEAGSPEDDVDSQKPENMPGGKDQKEPKPTSVEAAKEESK